MTTIDFKSEAVAFARENSMFPASMVQKAMERGAELAVIEMTKKIKGISGDLEALRISGIPKGETKTIQTK